MYLTTCCASFLLFDHPFYAGRSVGVIYDHLPAEVKAAWRPKFRLLFKDWEAAEARGEAGPFPGPLGADFTGTQLYGDARDTPEVMALFMASHAYAPFEGEQVS